MSEPDFTVRHDLSREEAAARLLAGIPKLEQKIPGGAKVEADQQGEDRMLLTIHAMGQVIRIDSRLEEAAVTGDVTVPLMMKMMKGQIVSVVEDAVSRMLAKPVVPAG